MTYWKALKILKDIKKHRRKPVRVWATSQLRFEISEKMFHEILFEKLIFLLIFSPILQGICPLIQRIKITSFSPTIFLFIGIFPLTLGAPLGLGAIFLYVTGSYFWKIIDCKWSSNHNFPESPASACHANLMLIMRLDNYIF